MLCTFGPDCIGILCFTRGNEGRAEDAVLGKRRIPGALKWCGGKSPDRREQRYTQERYTRGI